MLSFGSPWDFISLGNKQNSHRKWWKFISSANTNEVKWPDLHTVSKEQGILPTTHELERTFKELIPQAQ